MRLSALTRLPASISRSHARQGAGSIASAMAGRQQVEPNRYAKQNTAPCGHCNRGSPSQVFQLALPVPKM